MKPLAADLIGAAYRQIGIPYDVMDCQAFVEECLREIGAYKNLPGSNAWYRAMNWTGTPEECARAFGRIPDGAFLFILEQNGKEPEKYKADGIGNASHIGICTGKRGKGAVHSSKSKGMVCESKFAGVAINGGWNRVGLWTDALDYGLDDAGTASGSTTKPETRPTIRRGSRGKYVTLLQTMLVNRGYDVGSTGADGDFGIRTERAVQAYQRANGLEVDGIVGPLTWAALDDVPDNSVTAALYEIRIGGLTKDQVTELLKEYPKADVIQERGDTVV